MKVYIDSNIDGSFYYLEDETGMEIGPIKAARLGQTMKEAAREVYDQTGEIVYYVFKEAGRDH